MKIETLGRLVDTMPVYEALAELTTRSDFYDAATKAFLLAKLKDTIRDLHQTSKHIDQRVRDYENKEPQEAPPIDPVVREVVVRVAGEEVLRLFEERGWCPLCDYTDHDGNGVDRHEDECPLRPLDEKDDDDGK